MIVTKKFFDDSKNDYAFFMGKDHYNTAETDVEVVSSSIGADKIEIEGIIIANDTAIPASRLSSVCLVGAKSKKKTAASKKPDAPTIPSSDDIAVKES
jgi:hypothetical protein